MRKATGISPEDFESLLNWLSPEREAAGEVYEKLREGLIRFFRFRGFDIAEALADETFDRLAKKSCEFNNENNKKTIGIAYGFASKVALEAKSAYIAKETELLIDPAISDPNLDRFVKDDEDRMEKLEECLEKLSAGERTLILEYFSATGREKIEIRDAIAAKRGINLRALYTRVHRIKNQLSECVKSVKNG